jgi:hypothetical protein
MLSSGKFSKGIYVIILSVGTGFLRILFIAECQQNNDCNSTKYYDPIKINIYINLSNL